jgi:hypothetical protein
VWRHPLGSEVDLDCFYFYRYRATNHRSGGGDYHDTGAN